MSSLLELLFYQPRTRKLTVLLALLGTVIPFSAGIHKFYLRQPLWGIIYLLLGFSTPIPRIACAIESVWYLVLEQQEFNQRFNSLSEDQDLSMLNSPERITAIADSLRELELLRQECLVSEAEFQQKRRQLLDKIT